MSPLKLRIGAKPAISASIGVIIAASMVVLEYQVPSSAQSLAGESDRLEIEVEKFLSTVRAA